MIVFWYQDYQARLRERLLTSRGLPRYRDARWVSLDIKFTRQGFENACWHREACRDLENTWWVSFDIKFTRQGFENACWHREACRNIEKTRWVSFDIMFTRQGFENACWHREACRDRENTSWVSFDINFTRQDFKYACWHPEACRAIQHAFLKPTLFCWFKIPACEYVFVWTACWSDHGEILPPPPTWS